MKHSQQRREQRKDLIERMSKARCDIVAVQEVTGDTVSAATATLDELGRALGGLTGKRYIPVVSDRSDGWIRTGFLVASDIGEIKERRSFWVRSLPRLQRWGPARAFKRAPLGIVLRVQPKTGAAPRDFYLVSIHFKSKHDGWKDASGHAFETLRLETAEALRRELELEMLRASDSVFVILGDRNSDETSATAEVLSGKLRIEDFQRSCSIDRKLRAACSEVREREAVFDGLFARAPRGTGRLREGSYRYKKTVSLIDEILVRSKDRWMFERGDGQPNIGYVGEWGRGSDHKLLWAEVNW